MTSPGVLRDMAAHSRAQMDTPSPTASNLTATTCLAASIEMEAAQRNARWTAVAFAVLSRWGLPDPSGLGLGPCRPAPSTPRTMRLSLCQCLPVPSKFLQLHMCRPEVGGGFLPLLVAAKAADHRRDWRRRM